MMKYLYLALSVRPLVKISTLAPCARGHHTWRLPPIQAAQVRQPARLDKRQRERLVLIVQKRVYLVIVQKWKDLLEQQIAYSIASRFLTAQ
ncbi:hypothetical protein A4R35_19280 [Thermogemmatispora tikiterensis]|uniref:Uncharacterized protein n=1 Tax=Thermogemmatispora tikiterensis TaxID=1825093 RepID=A0A328VPJ4_9CHLR|nr:hypothetical protein A4R35_19280 [Thermogemmatispora tikiterensis]